LEKTSGETPSLNDPAFYVRWSSSLEGFEVSGRQVRFRKRTDAAYMPSGDLHLEIIEYDLSISADCKALIGTWRHVKALLGKGNGEKAFVRLKE
jgi:hypothetical protein